ncbi:Flp pilus assembly complex ATPase component TadA [Marinobacter daepoensis]|uniref:Flp pilus assembly complex ATPase component TadA n=1 Tax=Marinobacter daepoensis TaxID=262077 RepID=A0ABS3BDB0_9GAMM|nr:ATPase, T2SS/T4P/T4SS family [Marinobacter daepoensis]MBN7769586.1 Flp pilus assembly complex ATPase component TadA [Marinobacter daepoensis]MBY6078276.1 Flp pilus assembly complex ATPase component TadA [Marinobacter daepoensis]
MKTLYQRAREALTVVSRADFVAGADLIPSITGHSIPREETVGHLLGLMPEIEPDQVVMHIGGGSGYMTAVLARLAQRVIYVDRNPALVDKARDRFFDRGCHNVDVVQASAEQGLEVDTPVDLILCTTFIATPSALLPCLSEGGALVCLEGRAGPVPSVALFRRKGDKLERERTLGWVDFNRNSEQILIDLGLVTDTVLKEAREEAAGGNERVLDVLRRKLNLEESELYRSLARQRGMTFTEGDDVLGHLNTDLFRRFSRTFLDLARVIPVSEEDATLTVVTDDPDARTDQLERLTPKHRIVCLLVTPTDFRRIWSALDLTVKGSRFVAEQGVSVGNAVAPGAAGNDVLGRDNGKHISPYLVSVYEAILLDAVSEKASDIHIEQYENRVRIRLRVDGDLHDLPQYQLSAREIRGVINVIKLRSELNIAEHRLPQGGRSRLQLGDTAYDLRIQTQPSLHGENAIIRLLPQTGRAMTIEELGMSPMIGARYQRLLDNPAGLVLVVGPTGSGKSTTLYAGLQTLADDGRRKVITVEDPIEYSIDNIQQTRVRTEIGFSFADAMRAFVREDPDVILVGEIRDQETALEAIRASQTGHVVLSTLHCNDAVDSLQRLYDLGIHPNSIAGELLAVIAQRLAKRICEHCRKPAQPDEAIMAEVFPGGPPAGFRCFEGEGCNKCGGRGTQGRVAIVEYMEVDADIRNAISSQPPIGELRWRALDGGLVTMRDSALDHVLEGIIPLSELPRILPRERMAPEVRGGRRTNG